ncbi:MAG: hypothetical protein IJV70_03600 [Clostridia bacterium]|nr:hypothetical protein [Clostridia bacterium]
MSLENLIRQPWLPPSPTGEGYSKLPLILHAFLGELFYFRQVIKKAFPFSVKFLKFLETFFKKFLSGFQRQSLWHKKRVLLEITKNL